MAYRPDKLRPALASVATLIALLGGCSSSPPGTAATITPEPTGNPEMDRMLHWVQSLDAGESASPDLATLAAQSSNRPAEPFSAATDTPGVLANSAPDSSSQQAAPIEAPPSPEQDNPQTVTTDAVAEQTARLNDPDPLEMRLAQLNVPVGLLQQPELQPADQGGQSAQIPLAERLNAEIGQEAEDRLYRLALAIAAISPLTQTIRHEDPDLSHEASEVTDAVFELHTVLAELGDDPDLDAAADAAAQFATRLGGDRLRVMNAALCTSVEGFGRYHALSTPKFLSGRSSPVIVYVEVDRFGHAPVTSAYRGPDPAPEPEWEVRLSQELKLYRASESVPVWTKPADTIRDVSRNKRRDFHLTNQITLPPTLALGMYKLKITTRDLVTEAEAEETISLQIVSNPALISTD